MKEMDNTQKQKTTYRTLEEFKKRFLPCNPTYPFRTHKQTVDFEGTTEVEESISDAKIETCK